MSPSAPPGAAAPAVPGGAAGEEEPFRVGFAISVYQNSGDDNSNWGEFERRRGWLGFPNIRGGHKCGASTDFWHLYEQVCLACDA